MIQFAFGTYGASRAFGKQSSDITPTTARTARFRFATAQSAWSNTLLLVAAAHHCGKQRPSKQRCLAAHGLSKDRRQIIVATSSMNQRNHDVHGGGPAHMRLPNCRPRSRANLLGVWALECLHEMWLVACILLVAVWVCACVRLPSCIC